MRVSHLLLLCLLPGLLLPLEARAQVDTSAWPQVQVEMMAADERGDPLPELTAQSLVVSEGGKPHAIASLAVDTEPQSLCFLINASDAMYEKLSLLRAKARRMAQKLAGSDEVCVAHFGDGLVMDQPFTSPRVAADVLGQPLRAYGRATLRDALMDLAQVMRTSAANRSRGIILLSDARDQGSHTGLGELVRSLATDGSPVIHMVVAPEVFGHALHKQGDPDEGAAFRLTNIGGGLTFFPHTNADLNALAEELPLELQTRYVATFATQTPAKDGKERRMEMMFEKTLKAPGASIAAPHLYGAPGS